MGWAGGGPGELQKLKAEDLSCSGPWPDLEYLPLLIETPDRQGDRRQTAQTESSQQGPRFPQGQGRGTMPDWGGRVEGMDTPEHFPCARFHSHTWDHASRILHYSLFISCHPYNYPAK